MENKRHITFSGVKLRFAGELSNTTESRRQKRKQFNTHVSYLTLSCNAAAPCTEEDRDFVSEDGNLEAHWTRVPRDSLELSFIKSRELA